MFTKGEVNLRIWVEGVRIVVLKASVEDRRIDFRLVEAGAEPTLPPRGQPAKRKKQKY